MGASTKLISVTPEAEQLIVYCARVSNPLNQDNPEYSDLLRYLIRHSHWSPFEMAHMVVEIETSRAIAAQVLRHRSFSFQEFSQRYSSDIDEADPVVGRKQSEKNRQSSTEELDEKQQSWWLTLQQATYAHCYASYQDAVATGVSREQARLLLPLATSTTMYMAGSIRSWIHYIQLRTQPDTQKEHRDIALGIQKIFVEKFPETSIALGFV